MTYWHEPAKHKGGWVFPNWQGRVAAIFQGQDVRQAPFEGHFLRWQGVGPAEPLGWRRNPDDWFELWPHVPLLASSMEDAKAQFQPMLLQIEDGRMDDQFDRHPYRPPVRPELVAEIEHPDRQAKARIVRHADGRYQVGYLVYAPDGKYFPVMTPSIGELGWEWGVARRETNTFADDLSSAVQIAREELDQIVAGDPEIKLRETDPPAT